MSTPSYERLKAFVDDSLAQMREQVAAMDKANRHADRVMEKLAPPVSSNTAGFPEAFLRMTHGFKARRAGWNGKGLHIEMQVPDKHSKMTHPYLYLNYPDGQRVPWVPTQTDMFAKDWGTFE